MRPFHVSDDFLGHPNGAVPTPFLIPNHVNHLVIALLLDQIGGAFAFILAVGLDVDERTFDCDLLLVLLIRKLLLSLRALVGLVTFLMALKVCAKPKDVINLIFGWLGDVLGCVWVFSELQQASNDWGIHIYSPQS